MVFGDLFYEVPEPEVFDLPCGNLAHSFCSIRTNDGQWVLDVIPRAPVEEALCEHRYVWHTEYAFRISELGDTGYCEVEAISIRGPRNLACQVAIVDVGSIPRVKPELTQPA
jgi:hypothetical protein